MFNVISGASPFDPGPAVLAAANHLLHSGRLPGGGWDAARGLFGYNHSSTYVDTVLSVAARYGFAYDPARPPLDVARRVHPDAGDGTPVVCARAEVLAAREGTVVLRGEDGWRYTYAGLAAVSVPAGVVVEAGTLLGRAGPAGLRFAINRDGPGTPAVDPAPYLAAWKPAVR